MSKKKRNVQQPKIRMFKLDELEGAAYNPRVITAEAMAGLTKSLARFGCVEPIIVNTRGGHNTIVGGHQRRLVLEQLYGRDYECDCIAVNLTKTDEKLLNLTLNNPQTQGRFIASISQYIEQLKTEIGPTDALDLQIDRLHAELTSGERGECIYKEESIRPFTKTHVLISFSPERLSVIYEHLKAIAATEGVEYMQGSN